MLLPVDSATYVWVGTYTSHGRGEGIYVYTLDPLSGELVHIQTLAGVTDPSYLALAPDGRYLYAVNELNPDGQVSAFAVDPTSRQLGFINRVASHGADPAHLSVDPTGQWVLVANYSGGTIAVLPVQGDGSLGEAACVVQHQGSGPNHARQAGPHPHMIVTDPVGTHVLVPDLGLDRVVAYQLDPATGQLTAEADAGGRVSPGAGPRHLVFGNGGSQVYVIDELDSTLSVFNYDRESGQMSPLETLTTLPADFSGESTTAAVVVHPSGRFVYGSNRGHDSIAAFAIDAGTGALTPLGHTPTGGRNPRDFNIDPTGAFLLAANSDTDTINTFRIRPDGSLESTSQVCEVPSPVRVLIA